MKLEDEITAWLVSYLGSDSQLTGMLNGDVAPDVSWGTNRSPYVRVDRLDGVPLTVVGLHRVWSDTTYHIRGVVHWRDLGQPDRNEVDAIGQRLDELLHDHQEQTATIYVHSFEEESEPQPSVTIGTDLWLQSGGIYRIRASAI